METQKVTDNISDQILKSDNQQHVHIPTKPLIISFSEVMKYQTCHRAAYYRHILNLAPVAASDVIDVGVFGHKLMEIFFKAYEVGLPKQDALEGAHEYAKHVINNLSNTEKLSLLKAWTHVQNYINSREFTAKAVIVEQRFLIPTSKLVTDSSLKNVQIGFTPDLVEERKGGFLDVEDYKFVMKMWGESKINRFPQLKLYRIFLRRMNYNVSRCVLRFFNTETGKTSFKNYDPTPDEDQILLDDFMAGVREVVAFKLQAPTTQARAGRTMNYNTCQYCQFEKVCSLEAKGLSAEKTIKYQYKTSEYGYDK